MKAGELESKKSSKEESKTNSLHLIEENKSVVEMLADGPKQDLGRIKLEKDSIISVDE